jgi:hypothetical protein
MKVLTKVYRHSVSEPDAAARTDSSTPLSSESRQDNGGGAGARPAGGLARAEVWIDDKGFHMELLPLGETTVWPNE